MNQYRIKLILIIDILFKKIVIIIKQIIFNQIHFQINIYKVQSGHQLQLGQFFYSNLIWDLKPPCTYTSIYRGYNSM